MTTDCHKLDDYLLNELPPDAAASFALHLTICNECRDAVEQQRWIDDLLAANVREDIEPVPVELQSSVRRSLPQRQAQLVRVAYAIAATVACVAICWTAMRNISRRDGLEKGNPVLVTKHGAKATFQALKLSQPAATFVESTDVIAIPIASGSDNVTVVQLFPTIDAENRWRRSSAIQTTTSIENGG